MTCVRDIMTKDPITIDPEAPVATALAVMQERKVRHLPVVDDDGRLMGIITDRDLRSALLAPALVEHLSAGMRWHLRRAGRALEELRVGDAMTWDAITTQPEAPVAGAAALMFAARVGCLPVVENGTLAGIVTERDLLRALTLTLPAVRGIDPDTYLW